MTLQCIALSSRPRAIAPNKSDDAREEWDLRKTDGFCANPPKKDQHVRRLPAHWTENTKGAADGEKEWGLPVVKQASWGLATEEKQ